MLWTYHRDGRRRIVKAHRIAHEAATGEAPPSVDHLCHDSNECPGGEACPHRLCCNPAHLGAATLAENARRARAMVYREECGRGHRMDPDNAYESAKGDRTCRKCAAEDASRDRAKTRAGRPVKAQRTYRPRGMSLPALVDWGLEGNDGPNCWSWRNIVTDGDGYAPVRFGRKMDYAHRLVYLALVGPIPEGHHIDHTCHDPQTCPGGRSCPHRACVNPNHLEAVSGPENSAPGRSSRARATECKWGHEFTEENTYVDASGSRQCRECGRRRMRERHAAERAGKADGRARADGLCKNGLHDVAVVGVRPGGRCAECAREAQRRYKARLQAG